jgi:hypothetical protein
MEDKKRPDPITEGSLRQIYDWFLGKLIQYKPDTMPLADWMEYLFDIKNRDITRYITKNSFRMPGLLCATPHVKIQGIGYRDVPKGAVIYVRKDARAPDSVDVEWLGGQGKADRVFSLSASEWAWVELSVEEKERKTNRRKPRA